MNNEKEVAKYADDAVLDFIIQEFVPYKNEVGIFYYRYPGETQGRISGIVGKEFLTVTGDGYSTLRELCGKEKRFILQIDQLEKLYGEKLTAVLPAGAVQELVPYGNHARGAKFLDHSHLNDPALEASIDKVCQDIAGFFYGRLDVRYDDWEQLKQGQAFSIIELNGAGSEPTHIYDPAHSLFFAWKEIVRHWFILWKISRMNHNKGVPYLSVKEGLHMLRENKAFEKKLASQHV